MNTKYKMILNFAIAAIKNPDLKIGVIP